MERGTEPRGGLVQHHAAPSQAQAGVQVADAAFNEGKRFQPWVHQIATISGFLIAR